MPAVAPVESFELLSFPMFLSVLDEEVDEGSPAIVEGFFPVGSMVGSIVETVGSELFVSSCRIVTL